ncbi:hypothetical protein CFC21_110002 [Triticum aestivum]|uniref:F-box domain-containing protein n=2 Tax=Triticum aestivum TaxID=4565 RepID=A0A9R1MLW0_WHEAT|nr:hypothetical protein CFC21_110002 [Triticum aestivum]
MAICREKTTAASGLPDEMMTELFLRLPVRSLLRFRAVCRSWAATLSSEEFCALHMAKADADSVPRLLFVAPTTGYDSTAVYSCSTSGVDTLFAIDELRGGFVGPMASQCRGLTLLYDAVAPAYYVLNAATKAITRLPPCPDVLQSSAGLCFDYRTKEYKAVRLFTHSCYDEQLGRWSLRAKCEIYTLGGSRWRPAAGGVPSSFNRATQAALANAALDKLTPVLANGSLHWLLLPLFQDTCPGVSIMSFSVTEESLGWIRSPPFVTSRGAHLVELDGHLCMARDLGAGGSAWMLEIWKRQDSTSGAWSLHHRIDLSSGDVLQPLAVRVLGSVGNGRSGQKKIIIRTCLHKVHACDAMSGTLETILSTGDDTHAAGCYKTEPGPLRMNLFKESLAPVKRTNAETALSSPVGKAFKEILLRLPAKSVIQFKAVCTRWCRWVEGESFMRSYFVHKNMDRRPKLMLVGNKGTQESGFQFIPLKKWLSDTTTGQGACLQAKVVCSKPCHGLNLLSTAEKDYVYNPCTGYYITMYYPHPHIDKPWKMPNDYGCRVQDSAFSVGNKNIGLGFNPRIQEHVAVIILYQHKDFISRRYRLTCSLRECGTGSREGLGPPPLPPNDMPPAYVDGVLYWMSDPSLCPTNKQALVSFDIATEEFDVIPCPSHISEWCNEKRRHGFVVELHGMLCVVLADPMADELEIWIWKLGYDQWDKAYTICLKEWPDYSLLSNIVVPMSIDPRDGKILLSTGRKVGLYDPADRKLERLCALGEMPVAGNNSKRQLPGGSRELCLSKRSRLDHNISQRRAPPEEYYLLPSLNECSSKRSIIKDLNARCSTTTAPLFPMLYEESLISYPRAGKTRLLDSL